jgi:hypothetical protein
LQPSSLPVGKAATGSDPRVSVNLASAGASDHPCPPAMEVMPQGKWIGRIPYLPVDGATRH